MAANVTAFQPKPLLPFDPGQPADVRRDRLVAALPPALQDVLSGGRVENRSRFSEDGFDGVAESWSPPALTVQHRMLARQALDELDAGILAPASADHLLARVLALLSHFPAKGMTPEVERLVALDWADDLGEYPAWAIDAAARRWRRTRKWRPSIAEMRVLCEEACSRERNLAARLRAVACAPDRAGEGRLAVDSATRRK